jgi:hypothetical protein
LEVGSDLQFINFLVADELLKVSDQMIRKLASMVRLPEQAPIVVFKQSTGFVFPGRLSG